MKIREIARITITISSLLSFLPNVTCIMCVPSMHEREKKVNSAAKKIHLFFPWMMMNAKIRIYSFHLGNIKAAIHVYSEAAAPLYAPYNTQLKH